MLIKNPDSPPHPNISTGHAEHICGLSATSRLPIGKRNPSVYQGVADGGSSSTKAT